MREGVEVKDNKPASDLEKATMAAQQENWSLLSQCLQQLPLTKTDVNGKERSQQAIALSLQVLAHGDFQQRWEIAKFLPKLGKQAVPPLAAVLEDEEAELELRWFAARILSHFDEPEVVIALIELLQQTEDEELTSMAAEALAHIGPAAIEGLTSLLQTDARALAVRALACIRRPAAIAPLLEVVNDSSPQIREMAVEALGSFHDRRIPPILVEALSDTSAAVRREAVIALGMRCDLKQQLNLVERLSSLLSDFNIDVCRQAALSLGRLGSPEAAAALCAVLHSSAPTQLKLEVVRALGWMESADALEYLRQGLSCEDAVSLETVAVLGRQNRDELQQQAVEILSHFWQSKREHSRFFKQALALSLGELGKPAALDTLQTLAHDSEQSVRLHALAALKKLSADTNEC